MRMTSRFGTFGAAVKKELWVELRYPLNFFTGVLTIFILGSWFILSAQAFTGPESDGSSGSPAASFAGYAVWGLVIFLFMSQLLWSVANFVRREQMQGTLEQLILSSSNPQVVLLGGATGSVITGLVLNGIVILGFALLTDLPLNNLFLALYVLAITLLMMLGFSLVFGALVLGLKRGQIILNFAQFVFMFVCAIFFPFSILPKPVLLFSYLLPISFGVDMFRTTLMDVSPELVTSDMLQVIGLTTDPWLVEFVVLHVLAVGLCLFGWWFYGKQQDRIANREGLSHY